MSWLFRPGTVLAVSAALAFGAAVLLFWPFGDAAGPIQAIVRPVPAGDQEIVWLNAATNVAWERFVAAVHRLADDRPELGLVVTDDGNAFPEQTTVVPELAVRARGSPGIVWL